MEENKLTTREELKTYFETGKAPTQNQFSDLIDSLRHKEDGLTNKEIIYLANRLEAIENGFIGYVNYTTEDEEFPIVISSQDEEDQVIDAGKGNNFEGKKRYFAGNAPYTIKAKKFSTKNLRENEYYALRYEADPVYTYYNMMARLFGNTLPSIPDGFDFGPLKGKRFYFEISKRNYGQKINIVNTHIKFINKTEVFIEYMVYGGGNLWGHEYTSEDIVTDHYNIGDFLNFFYRADLRKTDKSIECRVYDEDTDLLLATGYLNANQNNINIPCNGGTDKTRNVRIECDYQNPTREVE
ncbi:hypothetical protein [Chryseobacterium sediminis]|uniref:hypothetical protein n=1 Tax=Chryseobacterium sediminis TaxID=1679494 RepID=UPI0028634CFC|nr:hypothetical protein [Chryseobacterium sediminis]MDR6464754.1 hypothetical protein [Chryseobacterium sediminis]